MTDREKIIKGLEEISDYFFAIYRKDTDSYTCAKAQEYNDVTIDAISMLKKHEPREITKDEWESWKKAKYRDPLCMYWRGDIMPFWILKPEEVHEPAYLIGDIKIFNGKPTKEKMHEIWLK